MNVQLATSLKSSALAECADRSSIVLFWSPNCGACIKYKPIYDAMAHDLRNAFAGSEDTVYVAKINWLKWREQAEKEKIGEHMVQGGITNHIQEVPTIVFFHNKNMSLYEGDIEKADAISSAYKQFQQEMNSTEELLSLDVPHAMTEGATEVNPDEFETHTKGPSFAMLYAPWCGFCKRIMATLDEAAMKLRQKGIDVVKLDYHTHREEMTRKQVGSHIVKEGGISTLVKGFPTLLMFSNGQMAQYTGPRTALDITNTMEKFHEEFSKNNS